MLSSVQQCLHTFPFQNEQNNLQSEPSVCDLQRRLPSAAFWLTKKGTPQLLVVGMAHQLHGCLPSVYGWLWLVDSMAAHGVSWLQLEVNGGTDVA